MKKCVFYYATVVSVDGGTWGKVGEQCIEPLRVEEREPLGKEPNFCCEDLKHAKENHALYFSFTDDGKACLRWNCSYSYSQPVDFNFCPFCSAQIVFVEHLKVKVVEVPVTLHTYHYEVA